MPKNASDSAFYMFGLRIVGDFGATLALPAVAAAWIGAKLDARWGSKPAALFACLAVAFALSALAIRRKAVTYGREYQDLINRTPHS